MLTMTIAVYQVVSRRWIVVILVDIKAGKRIIVCNQVRMRPFNAIVQDGHRDPLACSSHLPGLLDVHVNVAATIQVPHLRPSETGSDIDRHKKETTKTIPYLWSFMCIRSTYSDCCMRGCCWGSLQSWRFFLDRTTC